MILVIVDSDFDGEIAAVGPKFVIDSAVLHEYLLHK